MADSQPAIKKDSNKGSQDVITDFWKKFTTKSPSPVTSIFPQHLYTNILHSPRAQGSLSARNAAESYEAAAQECKEQVRRIVRECRRTNEKFADPDFDIEHDYKNGLKNCLRGLVRSNNNSYNGSESTEQSRHLSSLSDDDSDSSYFVGSVHRIDWIFEKPEFTIDGFSNTDILQGASGDCWWLAAVATICIRQDLMEKICVARDSECGVYGFVFYRDGEWHSTVVDDNLYLANADYSYISNEYDSTGKLAREYRKRNQTGSEALYFAKCSDPNETWLPLMEKAYAKIHGDYDAISGGWAGEGVEDLTGGVTTTIATNRVLNKNRLWDELSGSKGSFVFAASAMGTGWDSTRNGLALGHAYSILRAVEEADEKGEKVRLVLIRNPWGQRDTTGIGEWNGPWSDGSKEWTPYWLQRLQHTFGDDGVFWMAYEDLLSTFMFVHRTRIFDEKWTVVQQWTSVNVPWVTGFLRTKFLVEIKKAGPVVFALCQLDKRYFSDLRGQYTFALHFILREKNSKSEDHIVMVRPVHSWEDRSVSAEIELEPGQYEVVPKVLATRDLKQKVVEDVVKDWAEDNPQKLRQVGMNYDFANTKGSNPNDAPPEQENTSSDTEIGKTHESSQDKGQQKDEQQDDVKDGAEEQTKKENTEESEPLSLETLDGFRVNKKGQVLNEDGEQIGELTEGEVEKCAGKRINAKGDVHDADSQVLGKVKLLPRASTEPKVDKDDGLENRQKDDEFESSDTGDGPPPWNAVCVIGLRVHAQDPEVAIELVKPEVENEK